MILNPDTDLHDGALSALLDAVRAHPDALITPKLLNPDGSVNACGNEMHYTGITTCRGIGEPADTYAETHPAPLISGAAFIARRALLAELGGFDARYFMYHEDADLSLRARSRGYRVLCAADAVVTHHYDLQMSPSKLYFLERNRLLTLLKNLEGRTLLRLGFPLLLTELATWAFALSRGPAYLGARARGYLWLWRERRAWTNERSQVQAQRRVPDAQLLAFTTAELPLDQLTSPRLARLLGAITRPVYRWFQPRLAPA
jgi:GT2 family glycosyltransferase